MEFAGEVAEVGAGVTLWSEGDRVFGIAGGGANAEFLTAHERTVAAMPDELSWTEAAAVPEAFMTVHDALVTQAGVRASEHVLVHAVGSGVGLAAVQLARAVGAIPFGTARTKDKIERAREYGLEDGVAVAEDLDVIATEVVRWTRGAGANVVLDLVGGAYTAASVRAAAPLARILLIGTVAGGSATIPLGMVLSKRLMLRGTVMRARPLEEKITVTRAFAAQVVPLLARGILRPVIDRVFPLDKLAEAHAYLESIASFGKVVIETS
jgi:NADPH:quinone reductase-like Zn-dependent oxidoreductase